MKPSPPLPLPLASDQQSPFMHRWVARHAEERPGAPAILTTSTTLSYADLQARVVALAAAMASKGVGPGGRVLVALPNAPATVVASLAAQRLGATAVELDRSSPVETLAGIATSTAVGHLVMWQRDAQRWSRALSARASGHAWVVGATDPGQVAPMLPGDWGFSLMAVDGSIDVAPEPDLAAEPTLDPDAPALILYTSGSTGTPQGVIQTHRNIAANTRSIVAYLDLTADDRVLAGLPLYYCYGRSLLQTHLYAGGSVYLDDRFAFPRIVMEALAEHRCTGFAGVPLTFEILRQKVDVAALSMPSLRYVTQAGGAMAPDTIRWARTAFAPAGLFVMYGQTEATARLSYLSPEHAQAKEGSIGLPIPGVELRVVDEAGQEVPRGTVGELIARGDNVTPGYLDDPEATSRVIRNGWLWTGDLAFQDEDGFLFHRGRAKEILKVGGHRVSPVEIEQAVERHPKVREAAVCGVPDALMGEVPVAFVVTGADGVTGTELRDFTRAILPQYMVPVEFRAVPSLPRNEAGKLRRAMLATMLGSAATPTAGATAVTTASKA